MPPVKSMTVARSSPRRGSLRRAVDPIIYRYGWDTRVRHHLALAHLEQLLRSLPSADDPKVLDVGCGSGGIAAFLPSTDVVGVDVSVPAHLLPNVSFRHGTVTALPFDAATFPIVSCVDVLEHLSPDDRRLAGHELIRVASHGVILACPQGAPGKRCDAEFRRALEAREREVPLWLREHQEYPLPRTTDLIECLQDAAAASGRSLSIVKAYCEPVSICRLVRSAAARSPAFYLILNMLLGAMTPVLDRTARRRGYRVVLVARLGSP